MMKGISNINGFFTQMITLRDSGMCMQLIFLFYIIKIIILNFFLNLIILRLLAFVLLYTFTITPYKIAFLAN